MTAAPSMPTTAAKVVQFRAPSIAATVFDSRGLLDAATAAGWQPHPDGNRWIVPVPTPDGGTFTITYNVTADARAQYGKVNLSGKPTNLNYYIPPGTREAIAAAGGVCYLASGLTDTLSYRAAGIKNVFCWFHGELSVPASLADDLQLWGVVTLVYLPDKDDAGTKSAAKLAGRLDGSEINLELRQIPGTATDINDLWAELATLGSAASSAAFHAILSSAAALDVTPVKQPASSPQQAVRPSGDYTSTQTAIGAALDVSWLPGGHKSKPLRCPFHDDGKPSAVLFSNVADSGLLTLHCSVCGDYKQTDLADKLGIQYDDSPPGIVGSQANNLPIVGMKVTSSALATLPPTLRFRLCRDGYSNLARFIEYSWCCGLTPGQSYTANEWHSAVGEFWSLRRVRELLTGISAEKRHPSFFVPSIVPVSAQNRRGRPTKRFECPTVAQIATFAGMPNAATEQPAPLPVTAFQSAREYRKACHLAHVTANAKDWRASDKHPATKILAARVGTSKRTLWRYEREQVDAGELHKKQRFDKIALADGEKLTDEEKANGWHIRIIDGNRYKVGNYRTSIRSAVLLDDFEQFAVSELGAVIEPPAAGETASEPHDSSMTRYCRNCGQVARADFHLPRVCGYCEATGADLWHTQPPNIAPEVLAVRNGRRRE